MCQRIRVCFWFPRFGFVAPLFLWVLRLRCGGGAGLLSSVGCAWRGAVGSPCLRCLGFVMNAARLFSSLSFVGGKPMLILRDHTEGRIKVFLKSKWVATVIPGRLIGCDCEAVLLGAEEEGYFFEERTTWGGIMCALSEFQQTGEVPCMGEDGFIIV